MATNDINIDELKSIGLYAIRNKEGKWFRRKGYGGHGESWVDDIKKARFYTRSGPASTVISFFANKWPEYGIPDLIQFNISGVTVIDQTEKVNKARIAKDRRLAREKERQAEYELQSAQRTLHNAQQRVDQLKGQVNGKT